MIDVSRMTLVSLEKTYCSIITASNKFLAGWRELNTHNGCHMALQYVQGPVEFAHIKYIGVVVLICDGAACLSASNSRTQ